LPRWPTHVIDTHGADPSEAVLDLLAYVLRRTGPVPIVYERDNAIPALPELVRQLDRIRGVAAEALAEGRELADARTPAPPRIELPDLRATMSGWVLGSDAAIEPPGGVVRADL